MSFDPQAHLIQLPKRVKNKDTGTWETIAQDYLEVRWRVVMFREKFPHGRITTEEICVDLDRGYARFRCVVEDGEGGIATGYGTETAEGFEDYCERAETRCVGRALALLGFGTAFVGQDLTEGEHVADAPVTTPGAAPSGNGNGAAPLPMSIPEGHKLPCAGQLIVDLTPAQLHMLVGKVGLRMLAEPTFAPLQAALQAERGKRLEAGKRQTATEG